MRKKFDMLVVSIFIYFYALSILLIDNNLDTYDKIIMSSGFLSVILFLKCILFNEGNNDYIHLSYSIHAFILSLFSKNFNIIFLYEIIIIINLTYWFIDSKCPVGSYNDKNIRKVTDSLVYLPFISLVILTYKILNRF